jgi:hypothetical protein
MAAEGKFITTKTPSARSYGMELSNTWVASAVPLPRSYYPPNSDIFAQL